MPHVIHGHGERFAPEPGQEAPMAEQFARLDFVAGQLPLAGKTVLDCGSGTGYTLAHLASAVPDADYVGIDHDPGAVDYAKTRYPSVTFAVMSGLDLAFASASFDAVLSFEVLEHLPRSQQRAYVREAARVLRPGGTLVLSTPNRDVFSLGHRESVNPYHVGEPTLPELQALLAPHFQRLTIYGQYFADPEARERDRAQLRRHFTFWKRMKRRTMMAVRRTRLGESLHAMYATAKAAVRGPRPVYPFAIRKEDFGFAHDRMDLAKWFVCFCTR